jgi:hypothetical protein
MWLLVFSLAMANSPEEWVRVFDPDHPEALVSSEVASVLQGPPDGNVLWEWEAIPHTDGWVDTALLQTVNADRWHQQGHTGAGIKVAVFDLQWFGAEGLTADLGEVFTHDCWVQRSCERPMEPLRPRFSFEEGVHGVGCAEVIRALAPDVELHLVRVNGQTTLENAVAWAIREEIDIISMSLSFFQRSFYDGTGPIGALMDDLADADVLMVTSAGNYASAHWRGVYQDADQDGRMDFGGSNRLRVLFREDNTRGAYVNWDQFRSCGLTDLAVVVRDDEGNILGRSDAPQVFEREEDENCEPSERARIVASEDTWAWLEVVRNHGPTAGLQVDVMFPGGRVENPVAAGSVTDPGSHPRVFTVGAVELDGYLNNDVEGFSSQGPVAGTAHKPDIAGPDGLSVDVYGGRGFYGTSAATPAVAAMIALIMSEDPSLSSQQAAARLQGWAWQHGGRTDGRDPRWGWGRARLPERWTHQDSCGRRPLLMSLFLLPLLWCRRRAGRETKEW